MDKQINKNISVEINKVVLPLTKDFIELTLKPILMERLPTKYKNEINNLNILDIKICGFDSKSQTLQFNISFDFNSQKVHKPLNWIVTGNNTKPIDDRVQIETLNNNKDLTVKTTKKRSVVQDYQKLKNEI